MPPLTGDTSDAGQLGINPPAFQQLALGPAVFRRTRAIMQEGAEPRYELVLSASAVEEQVSNLQLDSANTLFLMANAVLVSGSLFQIETWSGSQAFGEFFLYRLALRSAEPQSLTSST